MTGFIEGQSFTFDLTVRAGDIDRFAALSGDVNPLHMDAAFARERGFSTRVVHGALLAAYVSRMVGMHCPGTDAILHSMSLQFEKPVYPDDAIQVQAVVDHLSPGTGVCVLKISIQNLVTGAIHAHGKVQVGLTQPIAVPR